MNESSPEKKLPPSLLLNTHKLNSEDLSILESYKGFAAKIAGEKLASTLKEEAVRIYTLLNLSQPSSSESKLAKIERLLPGMILSFAFSGELNKEEQPLAGLASNTHHTPVIPHLNLVKLEIEQKCNKLFPDSENLRIKFKMLVSTKLDSLISNNITITLHEAINQVVRYILHIGPEFFQDFKINNDVSP